MNVPGVKTQKEISRTLPEPNILLGLGNSNFKENPNEDVTGIPHNRGNKMSYVDLTSKPISLGIEDIDETVFYYFNNVINPSVIQNGERINVPLEYASPEKWKSFKKDGYFKDKEGALMLPIIVIKRNTITKNRNLGTKLDANSPKMHYTFQKTYNQRNSYNNFDLLNNRKDEKQIVAVTMPEYVNIVYNCTIQTYYMDQLNKIIEAVSYASDSYWGDPERFKFLSRIDSFSTNVEISDGENRFVKGNFDIKLSGYIIPDTIQKDMNAVKIFNSKTKIIIDSEIVEKIN